MRCLCHCIEKQAILERDRVIVCWIPHTAERWSAAVPVDDRRAQPAQPAVPSVNRRGRFTHSKLKLNFFKILFSRYAANHPLRKLVTSRDPHTSEALSAAMVQSPRESKFMWTVHFYPLEPKKRRNLKWIMTRTMGACFSCVFGICCRDRRVTEKPRREGEKRGGERKVPSIVGVNSVSNLCYIQCIGLSWGELPGRLAVCHLRYPT